MKLINHSFATEEKLPEMGAYLYEYVTAANGMFVRARRKGLEAMVRIAPMYDLVRGLAEVQPYVTLDGRVSMRSLARMFEVAYRAGRREALFYLDSDCKLSIPEQEAGSSSVSPVNPYAGGAETLIEVHSHHAMRAFFSAADDRDETGGFRIYTVLGNLAGDKPEMLTRVGIYGHFWEIPSEWVYEMPGGIVRDLETEDNWEVRSG
jgi:PRTRC genetic system protein A